jgi:hypothetical protein
LPAAAARPRRLPRGRAGNYRRPSLESLLQNSPLFGSQLIITISILNSQYMLKTLYIGSRIIIAIRLFALNPLFWESNLRIEPRSGSARRPRPPPASAPLPPPPTSPESRSPVLPLFKSGNNCLRFAGTAARRPALQPGGLCPADLRRPLCSLPRAVSTGGDPAPAPPHPAGVITLSFTRNLFLKRFSW